MLSREVKSSKIETVIASLSQIILIQNRNAHMQTKNKGAISIDKAGEVRLYDDIGEGV